MATKNKISPMMPKRDKRRLPPTFETVEKGLEYCPIFKSAGMDPIIISKAAAKPITLFEDTANAYSAFSLNYGRLGNKVLQKNVLRCLWLIL